MQHTPTRINNYPRSITEACTPHRVPPGRSSRSRRQWPSASALAPTQCTRAMKRPQVAPVIRQLTQQNEAVLEVEPNQPARSVDTGRCSTSLTWDDAQLARCAVLALLAARCCSSSLSSSAQWPATPCTARAHRPVLSPCLLPRTHPMCHPQCHTTGPGYGPRTAR